MNQTTRATLAVFTATILLAPLAAAAERALPVVFWGPDQTAPGDVVLLYGGGLRESKVVQVRSLPDGTPESAPTIQACDASLKFVLSSHLPPGVFAVDYGGREPWVVNRPELWFMQPTTLRPGLDVNQAPPDSEVQVVGKNVTLRGAAAPKPRLQLRPKSGGAAVPLAVTKAEPFSLIAKVPGQLAPGTYELRMHNGHGGDAAWSAPLAVEIKQPDIWPDKIFNVRDFGAKGDDLADDTQAIREALAAAEENGGGVVFLPWGTYRLSDWLFLPERTTLRGAGREATLLKWPVDEPQAETDFLKAVVFGSSRYAVEDLSFVARKADLTFCDLSLELCYYRSIPRELIDKLRPWGASRDKFFRRVRFQHWLLVGHPERATALAKKYVESSVHNFRAYDLRNFEVSDCEFQGANQQFVNVTNGRVVRNKFSNQLGTCWTCLGGGARDLVCEDNELRCASSFGWGWLGLQRVYSAHNRSWNFERGEREAMTCDISALPTARPVSQHWGPCAEAGVRDGKPFLRFDGVNWLPNCFAGGAAIFYPRTLTTTQTPQIVGNTTDTVFLEKPFAPSFDKSLPVEIAPRNYRAHGGTTAWLGRLGESKPAEFRAKDAKWTPQEFVGMTALVLDGQGVGQYRLITANTADHATLDRPWDIVPDDASTVGVWSLMRHMIVYGCEAEDTSAFAQLYGSFYDYIVDGCKVERTQGIWGQMGWFVQYRNNTVSFANTYHPGIGMPGANPEKRAPFGYTGLTSHGLRITKGKSFQYPDRKVPLFADDVLPAPVPSTIGHILRGNTLRYNHRLVVEPWVGDKPPGPRPGGSRFRDVVIDGNRIEHSSVGIQLGPDVSNVVLGRNTFEDVAQPVVEAVPNSAQRVE